MVCGFGLFFGRPTQHADVFARLQEIVTLEARVLDALRRGRVTLACAESLTGGLLAARLTAPPRSSEVFVGGIVSYTDEAKATLLGVDRDTLRTKGAVSAAVARQMAIGARERLGADVAVSLTGFAGPEVPPGGEVGLVFVAIAHAGAVEVSELHLPGDRARVREGAVEEALRLLLEAIERAG